jgi:hypothetical protein
MRHGRSLLLSRRSMAASVCSRWRVSPAGVRVHLLPEVYSRQRLPACFGHARRRTTGQHIAAGCGLRGRLPTDSPGSKARRSSACRMLRGRAGCRLGRCGTPAAHHLLRRPAPVAASPQEVLRCQVQTLELELELRELGCLRARTAAAVLLSSAHAGQGCLLACWAGWCERSSGCWCW